MKIFNKIITFFFIFLITSCAEYKINKKSSEVEKKLQQHLNFSNFRGIRQILKFDKNNTKASQAKIDYLNQDVWLKNISLLQKYNLSFDLLILVSQTENAIKLIKKYPNILFIINHALSPLKFDNESLEDWRKKIKLLSDHENIIIKRKDDCYLNSI